MRILLGSTNYTLKIVDEGVKSIDGIEHFNGLKYFYASQNKLTALPKLPDTLTVIDLNLNDLKALPQLPGNLEYLNVFGNELTSLPRLPGTLVTLACSDNKIGELPALPSGLNYLNCSSNELSELPQLPAGLSFLYCCRNSLFTLPELPSGLEALEIQNNYLNVFERPLSMDLFLIGGTKIYAPQYRINYIGPQVSLDINETKQLTVEEIVQQMTSDNVIWGNVEGVPFSKLVFSSADNAIVKVDSTGLITGKGQGLSSVIVELQGADTDFTKAVITVKVSGQIAADASTDPADDPSADEEEDTDGTASASSVDFMSASSWAIPELEQAEQYDLFTDAVKDHLTQDITRSEFCGIAVKLYEALNGSKAAPVAANPFTDTNDPIILKAYNLGIVNGTAPDKFSPNKNISRQEICVMIFRALKAANPNLNTDVSGVGTFADESQIASWAIDEVRFANKNGIMNGTGGNKIDPLDNTQRQVAVILIKRTFESFW